MKKNQEKNTQILKYYKGYCNFIDGGKTIAATFNVTNTQQNHKTSSFGCTPLKSSAPFGVTTLECEKKGGTDCNYTLRMMTDKIDSRLLARFDVGGPSHKDPNQPMKKQSVPTPHLHTYDENGILYCYQTEELRSMAHKDPNLPIESGFGFFCRHYNISSEDGQTTPVIVTAPDGILDMDFNDIDPNENIDF